MNNNKKYNKYIILSIIVLAIVLIGSTYAFIEITNRASFSGSANCYTVSYTKGQEISGELEKSSSYTSGKSTDIVMYSDPNCASMTGTLYLTTNPSSTMDFSDNALRYAVVLNNTVVAQGAINGTTNQVIYTNFKLNTTATTYKVYVWLDENLEDTTSTTDETYSGYIHADAIAG